MIFYEVKYSVTYFETLNKLIEYKLIYGEVPFDILSFVKLIKNYCEKLSYYPNRNPVFKFKKSKKHIFRKLLIENYVFIYEVYKKESIVKVHAVFNNKQNININFFNIFGNEA